MRELAGPIGPDERPVVVEEFWERRVETSSGRMVERQVRRVRWGAESSSGPTTREVVEVAAPLLRALAVAVVAPALGRLAVRTLAPRLLAALPRSPAPLALARSRRRRARRAIVGQPAVRPALPPPASPWPALPPAADGDTQPR